MARTTPEHRRMELERLKKHQARNQEAEDVERRRQERVAKSEARRGPVRPPYAPPTNKMKAPENLESLSKDELTALAAAHGIEVARGDGKEGEPLRADYIAALS